MLLEGMWDNVGAKDGEFQLSSRPADFGLQKLPGGKNNSTKKHPTVYGRVSFIF